ncbi:MAG: type II toxin-antitoxin system HipA family toxin [Gemmatimonadetes bacterium]|nr:type II toxin-antitoxin system HipA family toxin [Gemmatimonadota bacterium]
MTSEGGTFVFVQLPTTRETVICGRYELQEVGDGLMGRFVYGRSYLDRSNAVAIDPVNLPLRDTEFTTTKVEGMFGALRDTAPDAWGRMVIDRRNRGRALNELGYLLGSSNVRVGALSYGSGQEVPALDYSSVHSLEDLEAASNAADALQGEIEGEEHPLLADLDRVLAPSSAMGGARPKTVIMDRDGQLWVAKFPSRGDRWNNAIIEAAYLSLADECGIAVPESRIIKLGARKILLVKRFDQEPENDGSIRRLFLSAHSLLGLEESVIDRLGWSYLDLSHLLRRISSAPAEDSTELFRRMVFNALVSNTDDHPRNHAVLGTNAGSWRLSPAYDLAPSTDRSLDDRNLAMTCGLTPGRGRWANRLNLVSGAQHFGLDADEANTLVTGMKEIVVGRWEEHVRRHGGTAQDCRNIAHAIAYEGFEYGAPHS